MTTNNLPPFEKVLGWLGLQDDDKYYKAAAALPALFFAMNQDCICSSLTVGISAFQGIRITFA